MPDEDMEITTDFDAIHGGLTEDIDIDLDFASGQQDEDLELGDFNVEDLQNFNSDTRDELMAEGEDASFAMVDADEINYNESATAANDYDIDLGGPHDSFWQHDGTTVLDEAPGELDEINYNDGTLDQDGNIESIQANHGYLAREDDEVHEGDGQEPGHLQTAQKGRGEDIGDLDFDAGKEEFQQAIAAVPNGAEIEIIDSQQADDESDHVGNLKDPQDRAEDRKDGHQSPANPSYEIINAPESAAGPDAQHEPTEGGNQLEVDPNSGLENDSGPLDHDSEQIDDEHNVAESENPEWVQDSIGYDFDDGSDQASGAESGNTDVDVQEDAAGSPNALGADAQGMPPPTDGGDEELTFNGDQQEDEPFAQSANSQHDEQKTSANVASIVPPLNVLVNYGQTEYRLFARSEDDDPNHYFLNDASILQLPLSGFLSNLRDVISEELSPLDELVIHIDGLGLEFGETMQSEFLESNSFGDILTIWDILVQNEDTSNPPNLYCYLIVRSHCTQRLATLLNHANSGGTLTEIAVYRQRATALAPGEPSLTTDEHDAVSDGNDAGTPAERDEEDAADYSENDYGDTEEVTDELVRDKVASDGLDFDHPVEGPFEQEDNDNGDTEHHLPADGAEPDVDLPDNDEAYNQLINNPTDGDTHEPNSADVGQAEATKSAGSHSSSGTHTLNGDEKDEIDYVDDATVPLKSRDGLEVDAGQDRVIKSVPSTLGTPQEPDDEITWESDNEDPSTDLTTKTEKESVQVSPSTRKRERSDLNEESDAKRHRS